MHNAIDDKSHGATAKKVVDSCRDAINELEMLVHKIHETYNVTEVYITDLLTWDAWLDVAKKQRDYVDEDGGRVS